MIVLPKSIYEKMITDAKKKSSEETCGLIGGRVSDDKKIKYAKKVYMLENIEHSGTHFSMDCKEQLKAVRDMHANKITLIANFHSHPKHAPIMSNEDMRLAYDENISYLIISLRNKNKPEIKSFFCGNGNWKEEEILIK